MSASWALQKAIYAALTADPALTALIGAARVHDDVPRGAVRPYVNFARLVTRDFGSSSGDGEEHLLQLHVWSDAKGHRQVHEVLDAVRSALHEAVLPLGDWRLVNLRIESTEARRESDGETYQGIVRLRAVTEPA